MGTIEMKLFGLTFWVCGLLIGYVYVGYPLIIAFLARLKRQPPQYPAITPQVSMLIAAYNEERVIAEKIENSLALDYPAGCLQIVVAVDGSDDRTVEIVQSFADRGVELSYQSLRSGKAAALNRAIPLLKHDILVLSDANNLYAKDALLELIKPFSDPKIGAVTGSKLLMDEVDAHAKADSLYWRYESAIKKNETRLGSCTGVAGEILAIRKALYQPPPPEIINDDFFIGMSVLRQGYRLVYEPKARSFERSSLTERDESIRRSRIVAGRYQAMLMANKLLPWRSPQLVWQVVSHKFMRPLVPLMMIVAFLSTAAACIWPLPPMRFGWLYFAQPFNFIFLIAELLMCVLSYFGNSLKSKGILGKILYIPTFLVNSNLAAVLGLYSFFTGKQTSLWQRARRRGESA